jgi:hypothetical protein
MRKVILACALLFVPVCASAADDIAGFRLTDFRAFLELQYRNDSISNQATGVETTIDDTRKQIELGASTTSYVFHPKLLQMFIAGSLLSDRQTIDREQFSLSSTVPNVSSDRRKDLLMNVDATFQFLKDKPYPTTISYYRDHPVVKTGVEGSFMQEAERYGFDFRLQDILPFNMSVNAFRDTSFGESLDRVIDLETERMTVKAKRFSSSGERVVLDYEVSSQTSRNGDPRRPIEETTRNVHRVALTSSSRLGGDDQIRINQTTSVNRRDNPDVTDINFTPQVRWIHSSDFQSRYRYSFYQSERPDSAFKSRSEVASASLHYSPTPEFNGFIRADADRSEEVDRLSQTSHGMFARANSRSDTKFGQLNLTFGLGYELNNRESQDPRISIIEERVIFVGVGPIFLSREFVILETVVVRNDTGTQTYIEGVDYRLIEIGSQTQIERIISGSILDGETVLVDYEAETGGTFEYSQLNQSASADFKFAKYHNIFLRYLNNKQTLESGFSTLPFNSVEAVEFGIREQLPLRWGGVQLSGEARYRHQDEDINPYDQTSLQVSIQAPLPHRLNINASVSRNIVENFLSDEDADMTVFNANLTWQARRNLVIRAEGYYDEDTGGTVLRSNSRLKLGALWRFRKVSLRMDARYEEQEQGDLKSDHYEFWLKIRRELF